MNSLGRVWLFATPWTVAYQAPPSVEFSRQEYWSGLPFPSPGDLHYIWMFLRGYEIVSFHTRKRIRSQIHKGSLIRVKEFVLYLKGQRKHWRIRRKDNLIKFEVTNIILTALWGLHSQWKAKDRGKSNQNEMRDDEIFDWSSDIRNGEKLRILKYILKVMVISLIGALERENNDFYLE